MNKNNEQDDFFNSQSSYDLVMNIHVDKSFNDSQ